MSNKRLSLLLIPLFCWLALPGAARAQFETKALAVGELSQVYSETGGQQEYWTSGNGLRWPAIFRTGVLRADALWIAAENVTGPEGEEFPARVVHVGPRATGAGSFFPFGFTTVSKFEPPEVIVDGFPSFDAFADNDLVDPSLPADRMIETHANTLLGITLTKRIYAYSDPQYDNFHIQEYLLTNTGNTDADEEQELDQTLEGVYLHFQKRYTINQRIWGPGGGWGANVMNDVVGDGMEDYDTDFRAQYTWLGNFQNTSALDDLGLPKWTNSGGWAQRGDSIGRLTAPHFVGTVTLHAPVSAENPADDPSQPSMTGSIDADDPLTSNNDPFNITKMQLEYDFLSTGRPSWIDGHEYPHHADLVDVDGNFLTPDGDPMIGKAGGWTSAWSYGPYTLEPGQSVRIVIAEGVDGLDMKESTIIGSQFYEAADGRLENATTELALTRNIDYRGETLSKNEWWWSGRDSLFQTFEKAINVYQASNEQPGEGMSDYPSFVQSPLPPSSFLVNSGVGRIELEWTYYDGAPANGVEIYRARDYLEGRIENLFEYECIAGCPGTPEVTGTSYEDDDVSRGVNYFYYIVSVGPDGQKSNRYWTQTYDPASLLREPGETTESFRVVPNPLNISSDEDVRWSGPRAEQLGFLDIPGQSTIRIYTERGDLIKTIEHTTGSGDEYWDLTTESQQVIVSGLYIVVVDNHETGERSVKKFVVIR